MAIQDARQMFTTLMGQRQQRREGARNRLFQGMLSAGNTLAGAMEARRDREFEAEQKRLDRKNRLGVEAKRQSNQMALENQRVENEHDLFLRQLGLPDGINSTPEEIADAFEAEQQFRLNLASAGRVHVDTGAKSPTQHLMEAVGNVVEEESLVYKSLEGAKPEDQEALFAALLAKVERVFAEQQGRAFTDTEREMAEGQLRLELQLPPADTPTPETFVADDAVLPQLPIPTASTSSPGSRSTTGGPNLRAPTDRTGPVVTAYDLLSVPDAINTQVQIAGVQISDQDRKNLVDIEKALTDGPDRYGIYDVGGDFANEDKIRNALRLMIERYNLPLGMPQKSSGLFEGIPRLPAAG